jgi:hypothetical protein
MISNSSYYVPVMDFGSLESLSSVTTHSYIASRDQREREEDIYEVKPSTMTIKKQKKKTPQHHQNFEMVKPLAMVMTESLLRQKTCIRCHRPKMIT